ncbi:MAG TPA: YggS family pyridoxal phosphate-dependent enzyme [Candidatus Acidoferrum sp.]|nr:YggS family pyridoxal phosphate-dependent enzyme [Candidatus Acidoferrum sp.]
MSETDTALQARLQQVRQRIAAYEQKYAREPHSVQLVAVSKTQAAERVRAVYSLGHRHFGENYLQEALAKREALADCNIVWHFIGPIQSNKTRDLAAGFDWIHSVDRLKIAERLNEQRDPARGPLRVLIQVNLSGEASKSGCTPEALPELAAAIARLPQLRLRGLMAIPAPETDFDRQRQVFHQLRLARNAVMEAGLRDCRELSMGMSADFEAAIAEGATLVRIGSDIFGKRP